MLEVILILIIVYMIVLAPDARTTATRLGPDAPPPEGRYDTKI